MKGMILLIVLWLYLPCKGNAQAIDNAISYRGVNGERYARLTYENDYFSATDFYYTQGLHLELVSPSLRRFPLSFLLIRPFPGQSRWGLALEHDGYTPTSIQSDTILSGDRPFAAMLFLKTFVIQTNEQKKTRFSASLNTGVIGPAAGGSEMQNGIHRLINGIHPHGWKYQIKNDLVLNYQLEYERALFSRSHHVLLNAYGMARAGTLSDKAAAGVTLMAGIFNSPFTVAGSRKKFMIYIYDHPEASFVAYDATLQGGLLSADNPYTIPTRDIKRFTFGNRFGAVFSYRKLYLEYWTFYLSKEFSTGLSHRTGGIQIGVVL